MKIRKGDIVTCINNSEENDTMNTPMLTVGKRYEVLGIERWQSTDTVFINIINDVGVRYSYYGFRFNDLRESRKLKLDKLNRV